MRLIGIDTPEVYVERGRPDCYGPEASAFTKQLLPPGTAVRLERDVVGRDDYGRLLAYVYLATDGPYGQRADHRRRLRPAADHRAELDVRAAGSSPARGAAEAAGLGLWGACGG